MKMKLGKSFIVSGMDGCSIALDFLITNSIYLAKLSFLDCPFLSCDIAAAEAGDLRHVQARKRRTTETCCGFGCTPLVVYFCFRNSLFVDSALVGDRIT